MATLFWLSGFEHGVPSPTLFGGGLANDVNGTVTCDSTIKRTGGYSMKCAADGGSGAWIRVDVATQPVLVGRFYLYFDDLPTVDTRLLSAVVTYGDYLSIVFNSADNKLYAGIGFAETTASANALSADTWYRIDVRFDVSAGTSYIDWSINGTAQTQFSTSQSISTIYGIDIGCRLAAVATSYWDDIVLSTTTGDYPIGAGVVVGIRPNADSTKTDPNDYLQDQSNNHINDITAYTLLDDNPWGSNTDYIKQVTADHTGTWAEFAFENPAVSGTIHGVRGLLQTNDVEGTNDGATYASHDDFSTSTTIFDGNMGLSSQTSYKAAMITAPGGGWTIATLNALKMRIGYSNDSTSYDPRWQAIMFEVAAESTGRTGSYRDTTMIGTW